MSTSTMAPIAGATALVPQLQQIPLLDNTNYLRWKTTIFIYLASKMALGIVLGEELPPVPASSTTVSSTTSPATAGPSGPSTRRRSSNTTASTSSTADPIPANPTAPNLTNLYHSDDPRLYSYLERRNIATYIIYSHCSPLAQMLLGDTLDPHRMWVILKEAYDNNQSISARFTFDEFTRERPGLYDSIQTFAKKLLEYQRDLNHTEESISASHLRHQLTAYLPQEYYPTILFHQRSPWNELLTALSNQEKHIAHQQADTQAFAASTPSSYANANKQQRGNGNSYGNRNNRKFKNKHTNAGNRTTIVKKCFHCGKTGHQQRDCQIRQAGQRARVEFEQYDGRSSAAATAVIADCSEDNALTADNIPPLTPWSKWLADPDPTAKPPTTLCT